MNRVITLAAVAALLSACAAQNPLVTPYEAHTPDVAKRETAVLVAMDRQGQPPLLATLVEIDGQQVACDGTAGCPVWARLEPGTHDVVVRYRTDPSSGTAAGTAQPASLSLRVRDMKPRHVYLIRYERDASSSTVSARIEDLGENARTGILFPVGAKNPTEYLADF